MEWKSAADHAKEIRAAYKALGWNRNFISVRSSSYSMGSSINVKILSPLVHAGEAERIAKDLAEHISRDQWGEILSGGNQFVSVDQSDECKAELAAPYMAAAREALAKIGPDDQHGEPVEGLKGAAIWRSGAYGGELTANSGSNRWVICLCDSSQDPPDSALARAIGCYVEFLKGEFVANKPKPPNPGGGLKGESFEIVEATNKQGPFALVVMAERLDRAPFEAMRDSAKAAGGWYSRAWGGQAGGFGFADADSAKAWAQGELGEAVAVPAGEPRENPTANRLDIMAGKMTADIEHKRAPLTQNWTPKRGRQKDSAKREADRLEQVQKGLRAIAGAIRLGTLPAELNSHLTKKAVGEILNTWNDDKANERSILLALIEGNTTDEDREAAAAMLKAQELAKLEDEARLWKFPGFFPTPKPVIDEMLTISGICVSGKRLMLEPSAGLGHIIDAALQANPDLVIDAVEIVPAACDIMSRKGHVVNNADFMEAETGSHYDHILMNPPFERGADLKHVRRASQLLGSGGRLVSVMTYKNALAAVDELGGWVEMLPEGSFKGKESFRQTGVSTLLYVLDN